MRTKLDVNLTEFGGQLVLQRPLTMVPPKAPSMWRQSLSRLHAQILEQPSEVWIPLGLGIRYYRCWSCKSILRG